MLVDLDAREYFPEEDKGGKESSRSGQQEEQVAQEEGVSEVDHAHCETSALQVVDIVDDTIDKHVECTASRGEQRAPPPSIILIAQL